MSSKVFHRDLREVQESIVSGAGMYLRTDTGRQILDAVGGAGTVVLGHGVPEITDAVARPAPMATLAPDGRPKRCWLAGRPPASISSAAAGSR